MNKHTYKAPVSKDTLYQSYVCNGLTQIECAVLFNVSQKRIFTALKHYGIESRKAAPRNQKGSNNNNWKGEKAGRQAFHRRLYALHGKPSKCSVCETQEKDKSYDYANLNGNYGDIADYATMCRSCHWKYDDKIKNIKHMNKRRR